MIDIRHNRRKLYEMLDPICINMLLFEGNYQ